MLSDAQWQRIAPLLPSNVGRRGHPFGNDLSRQGHSLVGVSVLAVDIVGTTVEWRTSVAEQVAEIAGRTSTKVSPGGFTDE